MVEEGCMYPSCATCRFPAQVFRDDQNTPQTSNIDRNKTRDNRSLGMFWIWSKRKKAGELDILMMKLNGRSAAPQAAELDKPAAPQCVKPQYHVICTTPLRLIMITKSKITSTRITSLRLQTLDNNLPTTAFRT